jgi:hypothetical protein
MRLFMLSNFGYGSMTFVRKVFARKDICPKLFARKDICPDM